MGIFARLDRYATDEPNFRKPRHGGCYICPTLAIEHPSWAHRWAAFLAMLADLDGCGDLR